jgi:arylsulfatase A-like enzyme
VYIVLDDVGFSAMGSYGGPIETPHIDRIADEGIRYTQWHTTALCSPTRSCLLTGRNHTCNSMACITEAAVGFPNASGTIPPENGMLPEILGERGWNTYMVGKWHLCPTVEMNVASTRRFLAHADHHIGRLLDYLEETGQRENTMIIVVSDNGASGEGGPNGSVNEMKFANGIPDDMASNLAMLDELGGTKTYNHYPNGCDGLQHPVQNVEAIRVQRRHC